MYILEDSPDVYGLPVDPQISGLTAAWQNVVQPVGWAAGGLMVAVLGLNWLVARRAGVNKETK
jgi:hypothetical protein